MACIEVIMHLEEQNLDIVMANSELLVACYFIVESAVSYLSNPENHLSSVLKQKLRIQQSLNNAFAGKNLHTKYVITVVASAWVRFGQTHQFSGTGLSNPSVF